LHCSILAMGLHADPSTRQGGHTSIEEAGAVT
jgi:hypothetical protein